MIHILQNSKARFWCLYGNTGMILVAGFLFAEGQARAYSPSWHIITLQIKELNLTTHVSETINGVNSQLLKPNRENTSKYRSNRKK